MITEAQKGFLWISGLFNTQGYNYSLLEKTVRQSSIRPLSLQSLFSHCVILQSRDFNPAPLHPLWSFQDQLICLKALIFLNLFLFPGVWSAVVKDDSAVETAQKHMILFPPCVGVSVCVCACEHVLHTSICHTRRAQEM